MVSKPQKNLILKTLWISCWRIILYDTLEVSHDYPYPSLLLTAPATFRRRPLRPQIPNPLIFTLPPPLLCQLVNFFACYSHSVLSIFAFQRFVCKNFAESFIFLTWDHFRTFIIWILWMCKYLSLVCIEHK